MNNDGSGCAWAMLLSLVLIVVVGIAVSMTGLPTWDGSLAWDTTATADRQVTERLRIEQENETARLRIAESADTQRTWAIALASVAVIGGAIAGTVLIFQRGIDGKNKHTTAMASGAPTARPRPYLPVFVCTGKSLRSGIAVRTRVMTSDALQPRPE